MICHGNKLPTRVILSGAKDLPQTSLITLGRPGDTNFVGEVPHLIRDDWGLTQIELTYN
jgi:hypothetical protein